MFTQLIYAFIAYILIVGVADQFLKPLCAFPVIGPVLWIGKNLVYTCIFVLFGMYALGMLH